MIYTLPNPLSESPTWIKLFEFFGYFGRFDFFGFPFYLYVPAVAAHRRSLLYSVLHVSENPYT